MLIDGRNNKTLNTNRLESLVRQKARSVSVSENISRTLPQVDCEMWSEPKKRQTSRLTVDIDF